MSSKSNPLSSRQRAESKIADTVMEALGSCGVTLHVRHRRVNRTSSAAAGPRCRQARGSAVEAIPHAAHGLDDGRLPGVALDLLAELGDVLIEGAAVGVVITAPAGAKELIAAQDLSPAIMKNLQDLDLAQAELDDRAVSPARAELAGDDLEIA